MRYSVAVIVTCTFLSVFAESKLCSSDSTDITPELLSGEIVYAPATLDDTKPLTFADALTILYRQNPKLVVQAKLVHQAKENMGVMRANLFPNLETYISSIYYTAFGGLAAMTYLGYLPAIIANLAMQTLKIPMNYYRWRASKYQYLATVETLLAIKRNVWLDFSAVYYGIYAFDLRLIEYERLLEIGEKYFDLLKDYHGQPESKRVEHDELGYRREILASKYNLINAQQRLREQLSVLKQLIGWKPDDSIVTVAKTKIIIDYTGILSLKKDKIQQIALENSHELKALNQLKIAAERFNTGEWWSIIYFPNLGQGWYYQVQVSKEKVSEIVSKQTELSNSIKTQVNDAHFDFTKVIEKIDIRQEEYTSVLRQMELTKEIHKENEKNGSGTATPIGLYDIQAMYASEKDLNQATFALEHAKLELIMTCAKLIHHIGYEYLGACSFKEVEIEEPKKEGFSFSLYEDPSDTSKILISLESNYNNLLAVDKVSYYINVWWQKTNYSNFEEGFYWRFPKSAIVHPMASIRAFWKTPESVFISATVTLKNATTFEIIKELKPADVAKLQKPETGGFPAAFKYEELKGMEFHAPNS